MVKFQVLVSNVGRVTKNAVKAIFWLIFLHRSGQKREWTNLHREDIHVGTHHRLFGSSNWDEMGNAWGKYGGDENVKWFWMEEPKG
jgi:hypothetical protein